MSITDTGILSGDGCIVAASTLDFGADPQSIILVFLQLEENLHEHCQSARD